MKIRFFALGALALLAFTGCTKGEETPTVDPVAAKAQPGATTPPATSTGAPTAQMRTEKEGK